jgi:hypothetical protein
MISGFLHMIHYSSAASFIDNIFFTTLLDAIHKENAIKIIKNCPLSKLCSQIEPQVCIVFLSPYSGEMKFEC